MIALLFSWSRRKSCLLTINPKRDIFASIKFALLEVGIQLVLVHECKNLPDVELVHFHIRLSVHSPDMEEHMIEVTGC